MTGMSIQTNSEDRLLLRILGGKTVRLDVNSSLNVKSDGTLMLERGGIYFDSGKSGSPLALQTNMGIVRDIGTQFEVRVSENSMRIRVREGLISLDRNGFVRPASECTELAIDPDGKASTTKIDKYGPQWSWVSQVAPDFHMEGRTLTEFLRWVTRENGWTLQFETSAIELRARSTVLHGSIRGFFPEQTPDIVLPVCRLNYTLLNGVFTVKAGKQS